MNHCNLPLNNALKLVAFLSAIVFFNASADSNETRMKFIKAGLVDVKSIDSSIQVDLVNSDPKKNYFRENFYNGLTKAYLQEEIVVKLSKAQAILRSKKTAYSLLILDAARPRSVSRRMYEKMKGTKFEKFVANPQKGSLHNYGVAVDLTIVDAKGDELDMGFTPFRKSTIEIYWQYAKIKLGFNLTDTQINNRKLLADTMVAAGFIPLSFEWWHFNGMSKHDAIQRYKLVE
jgi:D-alanyl-D-alanine dipeptidase